MSKVYLVHESGKKYGPYPVVNGFYYEIRKDCWVQALGKETVEELGFTVEPARPEKITICEENLAQVCFALQHMMPIRKFWEKLCEFSETK